MPSHELDRTASVTRTPRADESGISMVELLTGMVIAVLLIGAALVGVTQHQSQRRIHGEQILAMSACRNMLETLRSVDARRPGL